MSSTIVSFNGAQSNDYLIQKNGSTVFSNGEAFSVSQSFILDKVQVYLKRVGSPTGTVDIIFTSVTGSVGTTAVPNTTLATSGTMSVGSVATSYTLYDFTFTGGNAITVTPGDYAIVVRGDNCVGLGGNLLETPGQGDGTTYPSGNRVGRASSSNTFTADEFEDISFFVWGSDLIQDRTQTGKSRITVTTDRTQTGKGRITATTDRTQAGLSRITITTDRTITGKAQISGDVDRLQTGKSAILRTTDRTQTGKASLVSSTFRTITGKGFIIPFYERDIPAIRGIIR